MLDNCNDPGRPLPKITPEPRPGVMRVPDHVSGDTCATPENVTKVCCVSMPCTWIEALFKHCCKKCKNGRDCLKHRK